MSMVAEVFPGGYFFSQPGFIGTSEEEIASIAKGHVPEQRVAQIKICLEAAMYSLSHSEPQGSC